VCAGSVLLTKEAHGQQVSARKISQRSRRATATVRPAPSRFPSGSDHEKKAETEPIRLAVLPHLLFSVTNAYVEIFSRAVIGAVPVLSDPHPRHTIEFKIVLVDKHSFPFCVSRDVATF
jgi:hypothetical protein